MKTQNQKENHEKIKDIKARIAKGEKTTFIERNIVNIYNKRARTKINAEAVTKKKETKGWKEGTTRKQRTK